MNEEKKIYFFIGTTAELIKVAPVIREFQIRKINFKIIISGQTQVHFEYLKGFIEKVDPDIFLKEKGNKSSVYLFIIWVIRTFFVALTKLRGEFKGLHKENSYLIIQGDTVSSVIGAVVARIYNLKLVHIESGDLSFNLFEPFPEEICRRINIHLADILFPPNEWAKSNLRNMDKPIISTKYNTLIESFWWALKTKTIIKNKEKYKKYFILIMHRQEHVIFRKGWSKQLLKYIITKANGDLNCLLFDHPLTKKVIESLENNLVEDFKKRITFISQLPYPDFMKLLKGAEFIATDGCTNQLEAYLMGKPCLALRGLTEQVEGIGKNVVLSQDDEVKIEEFLNNYKKYITKNVMPKTRPSKVIVDYLMTH